ncbi:MAG: hypothetical protein HBSAPP03_16080 [Phycisphaerae bacterium]|nr:MAG: hypothetical protein HBSAPP03_16080 [Phycisphaerae bacterium]
MTTTEIQDALICMFENAIDANEEIEGDDDDQTLADIARDIAENFEGIDRVTSFDDAALLTSNEGVIVRTTSGAEFQISIVQSRRGRND